jgi:diaminopropionate ammonia-lyase
VITIAEPETVACVYKSARAGDGAIHPVEGDPVTIMAGLNCGTPCSITWPVLRDGAACYCACNDKITEEGMYAYAHPEGSDPAIVSGESGAVTYGLLLRILGDEALRDELGMDEDSVILLFSTEGDTDPDNYRKIVYGG